MAFLFQRLADYLLAASEAGAAGAAASEAGAEAASTGAGAAGAAAGAVSYTHLTLPTNREV